MSLKTISHLESHKFNSIISNFINASLVNSKGELLYSKDSDPFKTTTSRLVLFQIAKKYLSLSPGDIIISNDPENGGTSLSRVYFVSCLSPNLFLIWDADFNLIDFKIPLMPFVEKGTISAFAWAGLVETQPNKNQFAHFFNAEINKYNNISLFKKFITEASEDDFQKAWFQVTKNIFVQHFTAKAYGQNDLSYTYKKDHIVKLKTEVDEKQNSLYFKADFSGTSLLAGLPVGTKHIISCASHVVESGLIIEFSKFYNLERYLSQPILDHIKLILPPKSVVTVANKHGEYNFELQKMARQMMKHNLSQINGQTNPAKKDSKKFQLYSTHLLQISCAADTNSIFLSNSRIEFKSLDLFDQKILQCLDGEYKACLVSNSEKPVKLVISGITSDEDQIKRWVKINKNIITHGQFELNKNDELSFNWKFN